MKKFNEFLKNIEDTLIESIDQFTISESDIKAKHYGLLDYMLRNNNELAVSTEWSIYEEVKKSNYRNSFDLVVYTKWSNDERNRWKSIKRCYRENKITHPIYAVEYKVDDNKRPEKDQIESFTKQIIRLYQNVTSGTLKRGFGLFVHRGNEPSKKYLENTIEEFQKKLQFNNPLNHANLRLVYYHYTIDYKKFEELFQS